MVVESWMAGKPGPVLRLVLKPEVLKLVVSTPEASIA
jgi:hypothetical protein